MSEDNMIYIRTHSKMNKNGIFIGIILILFAVLWILVKMGWIPSFILDMWLQIVLIIVGIFILYRSII